MSLILDALKKSEAERQRQTGPTLLEVRVTQPRRRYPLWVVGVGALLAVNIVLLLIFVLRRPAATEPAAAPVGARAAAPSVATPVAATPVAATPAAATMPASAPSAGALPASVAPMAQGPGTAPLPASGANADTGALGSAAADGLGDGAAEGPAYASTTGRNPADDEPAVAAAEAGHYAGLPSFSDVGGDLPALRLDLHVYAQRPRDRYALINMHRVHEGDVLPEGVRVLAITREGVALDWRGQEFMLHPQ